MSGKLDDRETLDQAVSRISLGARTAQTIPSGRGELTHIGQVRLEAAIRQGIAWAYRDAVDVLLNADDEVNAGAQLERKAEEASR